jgi:catechol 2,3-dioxygenase-like lactoylglutathione lyase family enzyme
MESSKVKPRLVGINHVALEVGDIDEALTFYSAVFEFRLRGRAPKMAFLDMGDQFLALSEGRTQEPDTNRHFGIVVDDRTRVTELAVAAGGRIVEGKGLEVLDPWGNRLEVVEYRSIQFSKTEAVLDYLGIDGEKTAAAKIELRDKGIVDQGKVRSTS